VWASCAVTTTAHRFVATSGPLSVLWTYDTKPESYNTAPTARRRWSLDRSKGKLPHGCVQHRVREAAGQVESPRSSPPAHMHMHASKRQGQAAHRGQAARETLGVGALQQPFQHEL
jgi:hypothetical protein